MILVILSFSNVNIYAKRYSSSRRSSFKSHSSFSTHTSGFSTKKKSIFKSSLSGKKKETKLNKKSYTNYKKKNTGKKTNYSYKESTQKNYYYTHINYNPPRYYYSHSRSFGMWDSLFLWMMIDKISNPHYQSFYYNHQHDEDIVRFREQAEKEAENNEELKEKLDIMDEKIEKLKEDNIKIDKNYLPEGISKEVAISNDLLEKPEVKKEGSSLFIKIGMILIIILLFLNLRKRR